MMLSLTDLCGVREDNSYPNRPVEVDPRVVPAQASFPSILPVEEGEQVEEVQRVAAECRIQAQRSDPGWTVVSA